MLLPLLLRCMKTINWSMKTINWPTKTIDWPLKTMSTLRLKTISCLLKGTSSHS